MEKSNGKNKTIKVGFIAYYHDEWRCGDMAIFRISISRAIAFYVHIKISVEIS